VSTWDGGVLDKLTQSPSPMHRMKKSWHLDTRQTVGNNYRRQEHRWFNDSMW
jgi:hypothetical protein